VGEVHLVEDYEERPVPVRRAAGLIDGLGERRLVVPPLECVQVADQILPVAASRPVLR
jgi:hypothetical protein